jgi:hypothetical protein
MRARMPISTSVRPPLSSATHHEDTLNPHLLLAELVYTEQQSCCPERCGLPSGQQLRDSYASAEQPRSTAAFP